MDSTIGNLTANAAVLTTHKFPIEPVGGPPAEYNTIAQLITLLDTIYAPITGSSAYVLKSGDTMSGRLIITQATANTSVLTSTGYSLTGANAQNMLDFAGTWNTSGNPTALKITITNTASGATAKLLDLIAGAGGATSMFQVDKVGVVTLGPANPWTITPEAASGNYLLFRSPAWSAVGGVIFTESGSSIKVSSVWRIGFTDTTNVVTGTLDTFLNRDAAGVLALRNTTTAQAFRWYRTWTDASNYERGALQTAAGQIIIAAETAGTGTDDLDLVLTPAGVGRVTLPGGAQLLKTTAAMTSGAAAGLGTLSNAPTAGNPAVWCPIMFNGVQHWFPCWT